VKVINTTAFVLALVVVLAYYFFSVHQWKTKINKKELPTESDNQNANDIPLAFTIVDENPEYDEELVAVITAAIHEFTGTDNFKVVSIKPRPAWTPTGRQNALRNWC